MKGFFERKKKGREGQRETERERNKERNECNFLVIQGEEFR